MQVVKIADEYGNQISSTDKALDVNAAGTALEDINTQLAILVAGQEDQNTLLAIIAEELGA